MDGKAPTDDEIGKGFEAGKDHVIRFTDEDLAGTPLPTAKAIETVAFIPADQVGPVQYEVG
ncbi:Ku protein [Streptomyces sp. NPDC016459]|uniref:Ku protein n=1 Tax=Streptomyces sp. NPDC016459 TaxID=3157190 RepID=UPI00340FB2FB